MCRSGRASNQVVERAKVTECCERDKYNKKATEGTAFSFTPPPSSFPSPCCTLAHGRSRFRFHHGQIRPGQARSLRYTDLPPFLRGAAPAQQRVSPRYPSFLEVTSQLIHLLHHRRHHCCSARFSIARLVGGAGVFSALGSTSWPSLIAYLDLSRT